MDRVLELGGYAAGYCGRSFVHAGADVVRVEFGMYPPAWASKTAMDTFLHAGKRKLATEDRALIAQLADQADVVICEGMNASEIDALGFDAWGAPVKVAVTPFGRTGPKRNCPATPSTLLAMGGYTALMGDPDRAPLTLPGHYVEFQTGMLAYFAANACRLGRQSDSIDIGMYETLLALSQFTTVRWLCTGETRSRHGSDFFFVVPSDLFTCVDGFVYINIVPAFWDPFTVFLDRPELLVDERFANNDLRMAHNAVLREITAEVIGALTVAEITERAETARIPLGIVQTLSEVLADPHHEVRGFWETIGLPSGQQVKAPAPSYAISAEPRSSRPAVERSAEAEASVERSPW